MSRHQQYTFAGWVCASLSLAISGPAAAAPGASSQVCTLGADAVGQPGTLLCMDAWSGAVTQSFTLSNTVVGRGGTGGTLSRHRNAVLVANLAGGAALFKVAGGRLMGPVALDTGGAASLSGAVGDRGAYVLTRDQLLFFPNGRTTATSSQKLLVGDGSAAQVALAGSYAYVSEKSGTLESFPLAADGNLAGAGMAVTDVPAGVIVGITGLEDLVVAPVAHLATNFSQSTVPVASGAEAVQQIETREVAACWAANDDGEVCITNPGSMTISCGRFDRGGFETYTSIAAHAAGETLLDLDMEDGVVGVLAVHSGASVLQLYARRDRSDFLTVLRELPVGRAVATGALVLPGGR